MSERFQVAFILIAVAVSTLVGVVTANVAYAALALSAFLLGFNFWKYRSKRSLDR
jgi:hypothetical protein